MTKFQGVREGTRKKEEEVTITVNKLHIVCLFVVLMAVTMKNRGFLLGLLFYPEEGGDLLLRNIYRLLPN
jgi:hypothetical protein